MNEALFLFLLETNLVFAAVPHDANLNSKGTQIQSEVSYPRYDRERCLVVHCLLCRLARSLSVSYAEQTRHLYRCTASTSTSTIQYYTYIEHKKERILCCSKNNAHKASKNGIDDARTGHILRIIQYSKQYACIGMGYYYGVLDQSHRQLLFFVYYSVNGWATRLRRGSARIRLLPEARLLPGARYSSSAYKESCELYAAVHKDNFRML